MTPEDKTLIEKWCAGKRDLTITLATAATEMGTRMAQFCNKLQEQIGSLKVKKESDETGFAAPAMVMGQHNNIAYQAIPTGKILEFFLFALGRASEKPQNIDEATEEQLQKIDLPVPLKIYVAPQCPHCPGTLEKLLPLAAANPHLRLTVIDAQQFDQASQKDQVRSVPTLILDDQFRWSGPMDLLEVLTMCIQRDPSQLSAASLRQLIEDGQAGRLAQMMMDANTLFPALVELLTHERWSVRLGAMVTAEYLADEAPPLAFELAALLWDRFTGFSDPVKGDMLHVIGQVNSDSTRGYLSSVINGAFDESVKEAAAEALEQMDEDQR